MFKRLRGYFSSDLSIDLGTANTLIFAERCYRAGRLQRFMHLSTALVAGGASRALVREDALPEAPRYANHYESSKHAAERIVRTAMNPSCAHTAGR